MIFFVFFATTPGNTYTHELDRIQARCEAFFIAIRALPPSLYPVYFRESLIKQRIQSKNMKFEMAATLAMAAGATAFVVPSVPLSTRVASSSASSTSMMAGDRSKALPMLPQPEAVREICRGRAVDSLEKREGWRGWRIASLGVETLETCALRCCFVPDTWYALFYVKVVFGLRWVLEMLIQSESSGAAVCIFCVGLFFRDGSGSSQ